MRAHQDAPLQPRDTSLTQVISSDASDASANPDKTDDLDTGGRIWRGRPRLRALWTSRSVVVRVHSGEASRAGPSRLEPITVYAIWYTLAHVTKTIPVREFRSNLAELLSDVADRRDHVVVTRNGRPAAVLVPIDEYQALEETAEILSDAATLEALQAGLDELAGGETIDFSDLRRDLAEKRAAR
jgi:antitoxin YefM